MALVQAESSPTPLTVEHMWLLHAAPSRVTPAALRALEGYAFPGNVRELRNAIEQAVIRKGSGPIGPDDLPEHVTLAPRSGAGRRATLAEVEADYVRTVLAEARGNKALAARVLGISRKNLYERLRRMGAGD